MSPCPTLWWTSELTNLLCLYVFMQSSIYLFIYVSYYLHHSLVFTCAWCNLIVTGSKYAICIQSCDTHVGDPGLRGRLQGVGGITTRTRHCSWETVDGLVGGWRGNWFSSSRCSQLDHSWADGSALLFLNDRICRILATAGRDSQISQSIGWTITSSSSSIIQSLGTSICN